MDYPNWINLILWIPESRNFSAAVIQRKMRLWNNGQRDATLRVLKRRNVAWAKESGRPLFATSSKTSTSRKSLTEESHCHCHLQRAYVYPVRAQFIFLCCLSNFELSRSYKLLSFHIQYHRRHILRMKNNTLSPGKKDKENIGYHLKYCV